MCTQCGRPTRDSKLFAEYHWLCARHRRMHGRSVFGDSATKVVTETHLLGALVFDFPSTCGADEAWLRARFATRTCASPNRARSVARAYGIRGTVERGVAVSDAAEFFARLVTFMCSFVPSSHARLVSVVDRFYPTLVRASSRVERAERVLYAVERATGTRSFFTQRDFAPLVVLVPRDVVGCVYAEYLKLLAPWPSGTFSVFFFSS